MILSILLSFKTLAADGVYFAASLLPVYGSGNDDSKSSMLGIGVSAVGGIRIKAAGFEMGVKRLTITNKELGDDKYDSEIKNSAMFGGGRLFISDIFSLKAGVAMHYIEMDLYQGSTHLTDEEDDGEFFGLYAGMGIMHPINNRTDLYYEATLMPVSDIGMYFVDMELGIRFYL